MMGIFKKETVLTVFDRILLILVALIIALLAPMCERSRGLGCQSPLIGSSGNGIDKQLSGASNEINKHCPMTVDKEIRLENTVVLPGKEFQYNYTLVNHSKGHLNINQIKEQLRPRILNSIVSDESFKSFREKKVTIIYSYSDKKGVFLFSLEFKPADYESVGINHR